MLLIMDSLDKISYHSYMQVYRQSNIEAGIRYYPKHSSATQQFEAEQDLYYYLESVFFKTKGAFCAIWAEEGEYASALRAEPFEDGYLISCLETAPEKRRNGFASILLAQTIAYLQGKVRHPIYSHVGKTNQASLAVHQKAGFRILKDYAIHLDGERFDSEYTLII